MDPRLMRTPRPRKMARRPSSPYRALVDQTLPRETRTLIVRLALEYVRERNRANLLAGQSDDPDDTYRDLIGRAIELVPELKPSLGRLEKALREVWKDPRVR